MARTAQPPSPGAGGASAGGSGAVLIRPGSSGRSRGTLGSGGSVFQSTAQSNLPVSSPTGSNRPSVSLASSPGTSLPRLGGDSLLHTHAPLGSPPSKLTPQSPGAGLPQHPPSPLMNGAGLPSLLEQTLSENRRFSNGMSPIPSSLMSPGPRPGSADQPPAFGRRASRPPSRSDSPTSDDTGSGSSTGRHYNHATANALNNGEPDFEQLDEQLSRSSVWRELHRVVRMCAAQPSCDRMVMTLERQTRYLVGASCVRLFLVQRDGLVHYSRSQPFGLSTGLVGYARARKEIVCVTQPTQDERFSAEIDQIQERPTPTAIMCVPVEADTNAGTVSSSSTSGSGVSGVPNASGSSPSAGAVTGGGVAGVNTGKDVVAVFACYKEGVGESFSTRDCKVLYRLGEFAGNMLRSSRSVDRAHALYNASLQSHKRSAALLDVAKALASETDLNRVVEIIVSQVPELLDSDRCTLFFVDREKEQLIVTKGASKGRAKNLVSWIFGQSNAPELPFPKGHNELRFSMHNGIAGHVAITGETINIVDAHQDPRFNSTMDKETGYRTRSMLTVPMVDSTGMIIGVLQSINKNPMYPRFDAQDETLLKTFAAQAALAVRNAQLFTKTVVALKQSDALLEVTKALSQELKIEALIQIVCSKVQALLHSERCTVFLLDKEKKELYTSAHMSFGMGAALPIDQERSTIVSFPMDRGIAGSVATTGVAINIPDAYKDARFNKNVDKETGFRTRSILCMAITNNRNECVGVVQAINKRLEEGGAFTDEDEKLLAHFCSLAATALANSHLFQATERALNHALADQRNMKFMLSVTKNLFSDMHLTSMIDQMSMQVHHLLKADDCAVYLVDADEKTFWLAKDDAHSAVQPSAEAAGQSGTAQAKKFPFSVGIVGVVAGTGDTIRISSAAHADARFSPLVDQRKGKTTHSILCCPIKAELPDGASKIVGVISVRDEKDRGGFEQEEEKLLKVFCAQAAVAIMNSKRFATIMDQAEIKQSDHSAADYLKQNRGMQLATDDIGSFQYKMEDIHIRGAIGTGSYGEVYRAEVRGRIVAVKKLHVRNLKAEQVDAFCKEASLMCQLNHTNIVGFIGAVTEPSNLSILTEYCSRGSLADLLLDNSIWMNFRSKVKFALEAAIGLLYLHSSNPVILHRDLKSDNLLVTQDWTVKVADFGLTRFISEKKQMTQVGTPMWMAPEIIMGKRYTERADVYAFGIILWEILTRLEPYEEKEPMQIVVEVVNDGLRPTLPAECADSPLVPLMKDCWHTDPLQRPPFEKVVDRLRAIQAAIPANDNSPYGVPGTSISKQGQQMASVAGDAASPTGR